MTEKTTARGIAALALAALALVVPIGAGAEAQSAAPAATAPAVERYRLVEVAGSALPVQLGQERNCREVVTRGALTLGADSLWHMRATIRETCGDRAEVETESEGGRYSVQGGSIRFYDDDEEDDWDWEIGRDIDVDELETGTIAADGTLTVRLDDGKTTLVFRK